MRWLAGFVLECVGCALLGGLFGALLFLPYALLGMALEWDPMGLMVITGLGAVIGGLMGIGQVFIERFGDHPPDREADSTSFGTILVSFYIGSLAPSWWRLIELGLAIIQKDYSRQKPGRWKRGLVGAVGCMLFIALLGIAVAMTSHFPFDPSTLWVLLFAGIAGGIAGALTDSR